MPQIHNSPLTGCLTPSLPLPLTEFFASIVGGEAADGTLHADGTQDQPARCGRERCCCGSYQGHG